MISLLWGGLFDFCFVRKRVAQPESGLFEPAEKEGERLGLGLRRRGYI